MEPVETPAEEAMPIRRRPRQRAGRSYRQTTGVLLSSVARMMRTYFDRRAGRLGLTRAQWLAINRLSVGVGITSGALANWMEVEPITASRQIANLETMGWAERRIGATDRRQRLVYLTPEGGTVADAINGVGAATEEEMLDGLTPDERQLLRDLLIKVHKRLADLVDGSRPERGAEHERKA